MNSLWNLLDWILPSVRLSDDLDDPEALSHRFSVHSATPPSSSYPPRLRALTPLAERSREWERQRDHEREKDRQRMHTLERDNAALTHRITQLETDLQAARQSVTNLTLASTSALPPAASLPRSSSSSIPASLRTSYDALLSSYALAQRALQERTEEVSSLKSFLSKTDEWSGAQLIQALRDLNSEIVQLAASVADEFAAALDRRVDLTRHSDRELVTTALGPQMTNLLASRDHASDPTLVQFAIQAWEIVCIGKLLEAFCFGLSPEVDELLSRVFDHMHRAEPQPTTSRWRALTHMHARALISPSQQRSDTSSAANTAIESNLRGLLAILALAGCTDTRGIHRDPLRARFGAALIRIVERAERIADATREGVMSASFEVVWVGPGKGKEGERWFERGTMDNVFAGHGSERSKVLCTTEFGLACVKRAAGGGAGVNGEHHHVNGGVNGVNGHGPVNGVGKVNGVGLDGVMTRSLLLKPKVLLESVAEML